jgi:quercetin dioxygenase-like cupin family protein
MVAVSRRGHGLELAEEASMSDATDGAATVVRTGPGGWRPLRLAGVSARPLRRDAGSGASTALLRLEPGARVPAHTHPAGEEVFVLEGEVLIGGDRLTAGDYLYTPPGGVHAASSAGGCVFLVTLPKPVEFVES